jgi:Ni,Fe-hydrogenase III large subunit
MWQEYTIERAPSREDLARLVRKMLGNGWQPVGGVCIDIHEDEARFLQSMVRTREE